MTSTTCTTETFVFFGQHAVTVPVPCGPLPKQNALSGLFGDARGCAIQITAPPPKLSCHDPHPQKAQLITYHLLALKQGVGHELARAQSGSSSLRLRERVKISAPFRAKPQSSQSIQSNPSRPFSPFILMRTGRPSHPSPSLAPSRPVPAARNALGWPRTIVPV